MMTDPGYFPAHQRCQMILNAESKVLALSAGCMSNEALKHFLSRCLVSFSIFKFSAKKHACSTYDSG